MQIKPEFLINRVFTLLLKNAISHQSLIQCRHRGYALLSAPTLDVILLSRFASHADCVFTTPTWQLFTVVCGTLVGRLHSGLFRRIKPWVVMNNKYYWRFINHWSSEYLSYFVCCCPLRMTYSRHLLDFSSEDFLASLSLYWRDCYEGILSKQRKRGVILTDCLHFIFRPIISSAQ